MLIPIRRLSEEHQIISGPITRCGVAKVVERESLMREDAGSIPAQSLLAFVGSVIVVR